MYDIINDFFLNFILFCVFCKPGMVQKLLGRWSHFWVLIQTFHCELDRFWGKRVHDPTKLRLILYNRLVNFHLRLPEKWWATREKYVCYDSNTPDVNLCVICLLLHDLWCHVERTTENLF